MDYEKVGPSYRREEPSRPTVADRLRWISESTDRLEQVARRERSDDEPRQKSSRESKK